MATEAIVEYIKSKSHDLKCRQDSVRNIIGNKHWGEDGRYKELILKDWLQREISNINQSKNLHIKIGTGFVTSGDKCSSQIDLIIYDSSKIIDSERVLWQNDLVIVNKESVLAIIEVKTRIKPRESKSIVNKIIANKKLIGRRIFAGIFAYECQAKGKELSDESLKLLLLNSNENFKSSIEKSLCYENDLYPLDCIALGENYFVKFWDVGLPNGTYRNNHYSLYRLVDKSFGYFILNIKEHILLMLCNRREFSVAEQDSIYPKGGKEKDRLLDYDEINGWNGTTDTIFADFGVENNNGRGNR